MPSKRSSAARTCAWRGSSRSSARPTVVLPEPDSPTTASFSRPSVNDTPLTTGTGAAGVP